MLNLITDAWIPVKCADGSERIIAPWQMGEPDILRPNWPRPDMNLATYEMLIGMVFMCDPPVDRDDWTNRRPADPQRLQSKMQPFAPYFNLVGDGPRFLQRDIDTTETRPTDMLFIDSAGKQTINDNKDLMVHRDRYPVLDLPMAAMALYTLQSQAPVGGAGHRASMRGGGPMITLVNPNKMLWDMIWANMPYGEPSTPDDLPWVQPSREGIKPPTNRQYDLGAFFGMPRRIRLIEKDGQIVGVGQKTYGNTYDVSWRHPLTPYYRPKATGDYLPVHPKPGSFGYREWLGAVVCVDDGSVEQAEVVREWGIRGYCDATLVVGGWSMDNAKPRDFVLSIEPIILLEPEQRAKLVGMIKAAREMRSALYVTMSEFIGTGEELSAELDMFYRSTEDALNECIQTLKAGGDPRSEWLKILSQQAKDKFHAKFTPNMHERDVKQIGKIVAASKTLMFVGMGYGKIGTALFKSLGMQPPKVKKEKSDE